MNLLLLRKTFTPEFTSGELFNNNEQTHLMYTLERPFDSDRAKVGGSRCAISEGRYRIGFATSPKFSKRKWYLDNHSVVPELLNVEGRGNILIHVGNLPRDTDGCILVGDVPGDGEIWSSTGAYSRLHKMLWDDANNGIENWIEVKSGGING